MTHTRRTILGALPAVAAASQTARAAASSWKPKIGVLARYTENNIEFTREAGFKSLELVCSAKSRMDATTVTDQDLEKIKKLVKDAGYVCKNCGRSAKDEENLCNPTKL